MGVLREIGRFVGNIFELIAKAIVWLIDAAIWAVSFVIDLMTDILGWINNNLEELMNDGATEVNVVDGNALSDFIRREKALGKYTTITLEQLNVMRNSVVNVAMDDNGAIINDQMIRSQGGLSSNTREAFGRTSTISIKIPA